MAQYSVSAEHSESATGAYVTPLALSTLAFTTFFLGAARANLFGTAGIIGLVFLFGGLVQLIIGIRSSHSFQSTIFTTYGVFWLAYGAMTQTGMKPGANELGYFFLAWTVFAGIAFLATMREHLAHVAVFLLFFLTFLALTIGTFAASSILIVIGGWLGIVTAIIAGYTVLASLESPLKLPTSLG